MRRINSGMLALTRGKHNKYHNSDLLEVYQDAEGKVRIRRIKEKSNVD